MKRDFPTETAKPMFYGNKLESAVMARYIGGRYTRWARQYTTRVFSKVVATIVRRNPSWDRSEMRHEL